jgi:phospholipid transport system substrate-binding protein
LGEEETACCCVDFGFAITRIISISPGHLRSREGDAIMKSGATNEKNEISEFNGNAHALIWICVIFSTIVLALPVWAAKGPTETIKPVLEDLTHVLKDPGLQGDAHRDERRRKIMSTIKVGFDFQEMCKRILGRTWSELGQSDKDHFAEIMTKLLENSYIGKLEDYHYNEIEYLDEKVQGERAQVSTLVKKNDVKLPVYYILNNTSKGWMVYDINIEGVSLVRNYKEQFMSILRTQKYQGLVKTIEEKNRTFKSTPEVKSDGGTRG